MKNHQLVQQIDAVLAAHASWHRQMEIEVKHGQSAVSPEILSQPAACFVGDWLESDRIDAAVRKTQPYSVVRWLHAECHKLMGEIVAMVRDGRRQEAIAILNSQCKGMHGVMEHALMSWREQVVGRKTVAFYAA